MLAEERWNTILDLVEKQKTVTVPELISVLDASESTVRRDLTQLARMRKLIKVHGGAACIDTQYILKDQSVDEKYLVNRKEKHEIASYAATMIGPEDFVYIDAGTTTENLVDEITEIRATYMTNSLSHARKLLAKGCRVVIPGGELKQATEAIVGAEAVESVRKFYFTIGFWGTNGVGEETGFTTPELNEAAIKRVSMEHTKRKYVLCDGSKFSQVAPVKFAEFESAMIITDHVEDTRYQKYTNIVEVEKL